MSCVFNIKLQVGIKADLFQQPRQQLAALSASLRLGDVAARHSQANLRLGRRNILATLIHTFLLDLMCRLLTRTHFEITNGTKAGAVYFYLLSTLPGRFPQFFPIPFSSVCAGGTVLQRVLFSLKAQDQHVQPSLSRVKEPGLFLCQAKGSLHCPGVIWRLAGQR